MRVLSRSVNLTLPLMATQASPSRWCAATCSIVSLPSFLGGGAGTDERDFSTAACSELELRKSAMTAYPSERKEVGDDGETFDDDAALSPPLCPRTERLAAPEGRGVTLHMACGWSPVRGPRKREGERKRALRENERAEREKEGSKIEKKTVAVVCERRRSPSVLAHPLPQPRLLLFFLFSDLRF